MASHKLPIEVEAGMDTLIERLKEYHLTHPYYIPKVYATTVMDEYDVTEFDHYVYSLKYSAIQ